MIDAHEYGKALFLLSEERSTSDTVKEDVLKVKTVLEQNPDYLLLLDTPAVSGDEKCTLIDRAFAGLDADVVNFLKLLSEKHATYLLSRCADAYLSLYDESRGIERVEAITSIPMSEKQQARLIQKLESDTGKHIILTSHVDPTVLGGMKLRFMGKQIDGSLAGRLSALERAIKESTI